MSPQGLYSFGARTHSAPCSCSQQSVPINGIALRSVFTNTSIEGKVGAGGVGWNPAIVGLLRLACTAEWSTACRLYEAAELPPAAGSSKQQLDQSAVHYLRTSGGMMVDSA